jgi:hypothetical protein
VLQFFSILEFIRAREPSSPPPVILLLIKLLGLRFSLPGSVLMQPSPSSGSALLLPPLGSALPCSFSRRHRWVLHYFGRRWVLQFCGHHRVLRSYGRRCWEPPQPFKIHRPAATKTRGRRSSSPCLWWIWRRRAVVVRWVGSRGSAIPLRSGHPRGAPPTLDLHRSQIRPSPSFS